MGGTADNQLTVSDIIMAMNLEPPLTRIDSLTDGEKTDATLLATGITDLVQRVDPRTKINIFALMANTPGTAKSLQALKEMADKAGGKYLRVEI